MESSQAVPRPGPAASKETVPSPETPFHSAPSHLTWARGRVTGLLLHRIAITAPLFCSAVAVPESLPHPQAIPGIEAGLGAGRPRRPVAPGAGGFWGRGQRLGAREEESSSQVLMGVGQLALIFHHRHHQNIFFHGCLCKILLQAVPTSRWDMRHHQHKRLPPSPPATVFIPHKRHFLPRLLRPLGPLSQKPPLTQPLSLPETQAVWHSRTSWASPGHGAPPLAAAGLEGDLQEKRHVW